ncbi:MAG: hypothetical protein AAB738_02170 [Patescibacteria group bacterium]
MARNIPSTVSGAGLITGFWAKLEKERQQRGISDEDFHAAIAEESPLIPKFADMIAEFSRPKLLEPVGTITIPATTKKFVAKERFVLGTGSGISYFGDDFKKWFLDKVEEPFAGSTIRAFRLHESLLDGPIIAELGGEAKAETTLAEIDALVARQKNGEGGILLTNGYANIFYVRDAAGVLRAVGVFWRDDGWRVDASSTSDPDGWSGGSRVFSRNS